jgi:hypothetical protein
VLLLVSGERERETSSIYWNHLSRFHLKTETEFSLRNVVYQIKGRAVDNVQNCDSYIRIFHMQRFACFLLGFEFKCQVYNVLDFYLDFVKRRPQYKTSDFNVKFPSVVLCSDSLHFKF